MMVNNKMNIISQIIIIYLITSGLCQSNGDRSSCPSQSECLNCVKTYVNCTRSNTILDTDKVFLNLCDVTEFQKLLPQLITSIASSTQLLKSFKNTISEAGLKNEELNKDILALERELSNLKKINLPTEKIQKIVYPSQNDIDEIERKLDALYSNQFDSTVLPSYIASELDNIYQQLGDDSISCEKYDLNSLFREILLLLSFPTPDGISNDIQNLTSLINDFLEKEKIFDETLKEMEAIIDLKTRIDALDKELKNITAYEEQLKTDLETELDWWKQNYMKMFEDLAKNETKIINEVEELMKSAKETIDVSRETSETVPEIVKNNKNINETIEEKIKMISNLCQSKDTK